MKVFWTACIATLASIPLMFPTLTNGRTSFAQNGATSAPAGFANETNGLVSQNVFDKDRAVFAEKEAADDGLGPLYNAESCADCHSNPIVGAGSQISELRAGSYNGKEFVDHPGGSLINDRAVDPSIQERIMDGNEVRALRMSLSTLGDGFVEAIADETLIGIAQGQSQDVRGQVITVPVLEAGNALRVGRFGWKNQHASLESFSADAYLNEMGVTSPFMPFENTSNGRSVQDYDGMQDPENDGADVRVFARFMRSTKAPPANDNLLATADAQAGSQIFDRIGCQSCHVRSIVTAPVGTSINGGAFVVPPALGNKVIHPFGDYLLHDVGTGDGVVQNGGASTRNQIRTAPLWGLRARSHLMHDGESLTLADAIDRHKNQGATSARSFRQLNDLERKQLLVFLSAL